MGVHLTNIDKFIGFDTHTHMSSMLFNQGAEDPLPSFHQRLPGRVCAEHFGWRSGEATNMDLFRPQSNFN